MRFLEGMGFLLVAFGVAKLIIALVMRHKENKNG